MMEKNVKVSAAGETVKTYIHSKTHTWNKISVSVYRPLKGFLKS